MAQVAIVAQEAGEEDFPQLADLVADECGRRLRAYGEQPRDANEHYETEIEVLSGGYAYRQLFEVIQNAADAIGEDGERQGRIHVLLSTGMMRAANTGAALDRDGVIALLNARSSAKRAGQIGRFGIGFKSLLKLGGSVDLVSRSIGLRFDPEWCRATIREHLGLDHRARAPGMRLAQVLDPSAQESPLRRHGEFGWATTVVTATIEEPGVYERLADEMSAFPAEFVLFLDADVELVLEVDGGPKRTITRRREEDIFVVDDGSVESRWRLFQTKVRVTDAAAHSDAQHLQAREEVPLAWAVPIGGRETAGRFWAFFPTQSETLASGILNAPWKLNSDRTNVIAGPWNTTLMRAAAGLIADNIARLSTPDDPGAPVSAFPRQLERKDELAASLVAPLWDLLIERDVLANCAGELSATSELGRHPVEDGEVLRWWSSFADESARLRLVHPSCQTGRRRASRLEAFLREIADRLPKGAAAPLRQWTDVEWLEAAAHPAASVAIPFLQFVDEIINTRGLLSQHGVRHARIVPSHGGTLLLPRQAIIAPASLVPSGLSAVLRHVAEDERARGVLTATLGVRELSDDVWKDLLRDSFAIASKVGKESAWLTFWANLAEAPPEAARPFFKRTEASTLYYRTAAGGFRPRDEVLVTAPSDHAGVPPPITMDMEFHAPHRNRLPPEAWETYPVLSTRMVEEWEGLNWESMRPYFDKIQEVGRLRITGNPRHGKLGILDREFIVMPSGWRMLPVLPVEHAAALTDRLIEAMESSSWAHHSGGKGQSSSFPPISYGHATRREHYDILTAPHPLLFWLGRFGHLTIGDVVVRLKSLPVEVVDALSFIGVPAARRIQSLNLAFSIPVNIRVARDTDELRPEVKHAFWQAVFVQLEQARDHFEYLRPLWERASVDGEVPERVPTADGVLLIGEVFVAVDSDVAGAITDDGHIVVLSEAAADLWEKAGALSLVENKEASCVEQLGEPLPLRDIFPVLSPVLTTRDAKRADAAWVRGLVERSGRRVGEPVLARDVTGLIMIDRDRFQSLTWKEGMITLLKTLIEFGLLAGDPDALLGELRTARSQEARTVVRSAVTLPERLLRAVGGTALPLIGTLPEPVVEAVSADIEDEAWAKLALAVHGPTILTKLIDVFEAEGLEPPGRWGGEAARQFVVELGFPLEFATSAAVRREAELLVGGPLTLPELHDYQADILEELRKLLASGPGRRRAVVSLPTGGGKTRVAAEAIVRLVLNGEDHRSALWIAQTDELCEQSVQCFRQLWSNVGATGEDLRIVRLWGGQSSPTPPEAGEAIVVIASIQTLNARLEHESLEWLSRPGVVVIDECHHAIAPSYSSLLRWLDVQIGTEAGRESEPPVIGLSATPWRGRDDDESARLANRFDRRWFPKDQEGLHQELKRKKVLCELSYTPIRYDRPVSLSDANIRYFEQYGELPESVVEQIGADPDRNQTILERVLTSSASSILLFANSVKHAQYLAARLHLAGCPAAAVSGDTDRLARQHFIRRFRSGDLRVLCNHSVLTTGFDAPRSDMIFISRPVFSAVRYMQMVGRGLRGPANGGTEACEVVTVEDNILNYRDRLAHHYCRRFFDAVA